MRLALCAAAVVAAFAVSPAAAQEANPIQALESCVLEQAKRLEISGEAADVVAVAAVANCSTELTAATPASRNTRANIEARTQMKDAMREAAIVAVVETRTEAKTPPPPAPRTETPPPRRAAPAPARRTTTPARPATPAIPAP